MNALPALSSLLHLIGLALWLGGMVFFLIVVGPAVRELPPRIAVLTMNRSRIGLEKISWAAIVILLLSGVGNFVLRYPGGAPPPGQFYLILLVAKLLLFFAMTMHHGLQVFKYAPRIAALTAQLKPDEIEWPEPLLALWRKWFTLLKINAALGPVAVLLGLALVKN